MTRGAAGPQGTGRRRCRGRRPAPPCRAAAAGREWRSADARGPVEPCSPFCASAPPKHRAHNAQNPRYAQNATKCELAGAESGFSLASAQAALGGPTTKESSDATGDVRAAAARSGREALLRSRIRAARVGARDPRIHDGARVHDPDHDEAAHPDGRADPRAHHLRSLRGCGPRPRRHGARRDRQHGADGGAPHVRDHVLRDHDRRGAVRSADPRHHAPPRRRSREGRARHGAPGRGRLARRRRIDDVHHHDLGDAADLPAARHEPRGAHLRRRPHERHDEHPPLGRAHGARRDRAEPAGVGRVRADDPRHAGRPRRGLRLRLDARHPGAQPSRPHRRDPARRRRRRRPAGRGAEAVPRRGQQAGRPRLAAHGQPGDRRDRRARSGCRRGRPDRHGHGRHHARSEPRDAAAQAHLGEPGAHRRRDGAAGARHHAAALRLHGRCGPRARAELPQAEGSGGRDRGARAQHRRRRVHGDRGRRARRRALGHRHGRRDGEVDHGGAAERGGPVPGADHGRAVDPVHLLHVERRLLLRDTPGAVAERGTLRHRPRRDGARVDHGPAGAPAEPARAGDPAARLAREREPRRPPQEGAVAGDGRVARDARGRDPDGRDPAVRRLLDRAAVPRRAQDVRSTGQSVELGHRRNGAGEAGDEHEAAEPSGRCDAGACATGALGEDPERDEGSEAVPDHGVAVADLADRRIGRSVPGGGVGPDGLGQLGDAHLEAGGLEPLGEPGEPVVVGGRGVPVQDRGPG
uniref:LigA n=1 Tax=Parastrongyloides trichosuri TaxID=131310 RepID=A0A0N5A4M4_PARTI